MHARDKSYIFARRAKISRAGRVTSAAAQTQRTNIMATNKKDLGIIEACLAGEEKKVRTSEPSRQPEEGGRSNTDVPPGVNMEVREMHETLRKMWEEHGWRPSHACWGRVRDGGHPKMPFQHFMGTPPPCLSVDHSSIPYCPGGRNLRGGGHQPLRRENGHEMS